ncbi:hypothetical protein T06_9775 [Trichinella sp. T6]|nr:hypothetical protein T06_9775 [Trichinella sp. T6]
MYKIWKESLIKRLLIKRKWKRNTATKSLFKIMFWITQQRKNVRSTTVTSTDKHNQHYQLHHYCHSSSKLSKKTVLNQYCVKVLICNWNIQKVVVVVVVAAVVEEVEHCYSIELNRSSLRELTCQFLMRFVEKLLKHETDSGLKNQSKNERGQAGGVSTWEFVSPAASVEKRYFSCLSSNAIDLLLLDSVTHPMYNNQFLLLKIF